MSRFFKTLKPYWKSVLLIIALLVLQAYADLSLPQYTSDIIDTGIQNGGVSHCMPQAVTKEEFELAKVFMTEDEVAIWEDSYREDGDVYRLDVTDEKKLADIPPKVIAEYRKEAVRNVRRTRGKVNLDDLIARNNREFAEQNIAENSCEYGEGDVIVNAYEVDDNEL